MSATLLGLKVQVSPDSWKDASAHTMKLSQAIITRSDKGILSSRRTDPLPLLRDACVKESNDRIHEYVRTTGTVVLQLRKKLVETNEEIKALSRGKESLERALEHTRKDLALSHQSIKIRSLRPAREKIPDAADQCLLEERSHLLSVKRSLEAQLRKAQQQQQVLSVARAQLAAIIQERSRVTDLLCHSMSSTVASTVAVSHFTSPLQVYSQGKKVGFLPPSLVPGSQWSWRVQSSRGLNRVQRSKSFSAPVPLQLCVVGEEVGEREEDLEQTGPGPYDSFSPESQDSIEQALEAISKSQEIRRDLRLAMDHTRLSQTATHSTVNEGLTRKLAETVTLTQHLQVNAGQTSLALHRGQRCMEAQERGQGYLLGPVSTADITTREKMDRPLVRVFQRHPGTDLPEALHFAQVNAAYNESLQTTRKNLLLLRLAQKSLQSDIRDKKAASEIDSGIVRMRRQRANHKWVLDGNVTSRPPGTLAPPTTKWGRGTSPGSGRVDRNCSTRSGHSWQANSY